MTKRCRTRSWTGAMEGGIADGSKGTGCRGPVRGREWKTGGNSHVFCNPAHPCRGWKQRRECGWEAFAGVGRKWGLMGGHGLIFEAGWSIYVNVGPEGSARTFF